MTNEASRILQHAVENQWNIYQDLPWDLDVDRMSLVGDETVSFAARTPQFQKLNPEDQQEFLLEETVFYVCGLLAGEFKGMSLSAQVMLACEDQFPEWSLIASTIAADERNHYIALERYLKSKLSLTFEPHPKLRAVLDELSKEDSFEVKLFIGQVVLEWTAASLLASIVMKHPEPLFGKLLKRILSEEGRHLAFNRIVFSHLEEKRLKHVQKRVEELMFEAILACMCSLCAIPVWDRYGIDRSTATTMAYEDMQQRGVLRFYTKILPQMLGRYRLGSDHLIKHLENSLEKKFITQNDGHRVEEVKHAV